MFDRKGAISAISQDLDGSAMLLSLGIGILLSSGTIDSEPASALRDLRTLESEIDCGEGAERLDGDDRLCRLAAGAIDIALDDRRIMARLPQEAATTGPALSDALHLIERASQSVRA